MSDSGNFDFESPDPAQAAAGVPTQPPAGMPNDLPAGMPVTAEPATAPPAAPAAPAAGPPSLGGSQPLGSTVDFAAYCRNAFKIYGEGDTEVRALNDVTVGFETGKFTSIMGPSGSGKSTLMQCMAGLDSLSAGQTYVGSIELGSLKDKELTMLRRSQIGFIFQAFNLIPTLSAQENITLPLDLAGASPDQQWLDQVINTVGLADRMDHRPNELSGGQQQRVAVARALASRPDIIFGDEPTGNLDSKTGAEILEFMQRAVREFHQTIVMVTHDPVAAGYADRVVFLADGRIVDELLDPTPDHVLDRMRRIAD